METHLQKELEELKENLLKMATLVEETIRDSVQSFVRRDSELAREIFKKRDEINSIQVSIDNICLKLLAFEKLMATALRFISMAMKITTDLGRMGDNAVKIAEHGLSLNQEPQFKPYIDISKMAGIAQSMIRDVIDAFVNRDSNLARSAWKRDDLVDKLNNQVMKELLTYVTEDPKNITRAVRVMIVCRCLERIGDHAANIAEDVIFMVDVPVTKHHADIKEGNRGDA